MKRSSSSGLDPERIFRAAVAAYLDGAQGERGPRPEATDAHAGRGHGRWALALGVALGIGARAAYRRARQLDLERIARTVERRIVS